ncbi:hypothetical protein D3C84_748590 [compost metagenome]
MPKSELSSCSCESPSVMNWATSGFWLSPSTNRILLQSSKKYSSSKGTIRLWNISVSLSKRAAPSATSVNEVKYAWPIQWSRSYRISMRSLMRSSIKRTSMAPMSVVISSPASGALCGSSSFFSARVSGISGTKSKRRRRAVSNKASERSAVFIVPMMSTLAGTEKGFPE